MISRIWKYVEEEKKKQNSDNKENMKNELEFHQWR